MIILFVGQNIADGQLLPVEVDRSNKSELVATKIEHEVSPDFVDGVERVAQIDKRLKRTAFNYSVPGLKWACGFRMENISIRDNFQKYIQIFTPIPGVLVASQVAALR